MFKQYNISIQKQLAMSSGYFSSGSILTDNQNSIDFIIESLLSI